VIGSLVFSYLFEGALMKFTILVMTFITILISTPTFALILMCEVRLENEEPITMNLVEDELGNINYFESVIDDYSGLTHIIVSENEKKNIIYVDIVDVIGGKELKISSSALMASYDYKFLMDKDYYSRTKIRTIFCN
jgi:hypothetical protein